MKLRKNKTLYTEYVETINNYTEISVFNYESNGYEKTELIGGDAIMKEVVFGKIDNSSWYYNNFTSQLKTNN